MPVTEDQIQEKYLERAIRELNLLSHEIGDCTECPRGSLMPVLGSGHPRAEVMLCKYAPAPAEIEEGVAFYGRTGNAVMKSLKRLGVDPMIVYGTVFAKCPLADANMAAPSCLARVADEIAIVQPRCIVVMGEAALETLNDIELPMAREVEEAPGQVQAMTPTIDAIYTPDIDASLDSDASKREFWQAFRALGDWYEEMPPY
ncbi:MAG: uracil-DNA glycosylase family protein [Solirubrobacterales bacterium]